MVASITLSFPSLTHLVLTIAQNACVPAISHLVLLKSLTDLRLTINKCEPKRDLMALQPLAPVLTQLTLYLESLDNNNDNNGYQTMLYLLPFQSLTYLCLLIASKPDIKGYWMKMTGSFINQHWNKLDYPSISVSATQVDLISLLRESITLSSSPTLGDNNDSLSLGIKLYLHSLVEVDQFLARMENASLLISSSSSSPSSSSSLLSSTTTSSSSMHPIRIPRISLQCLVYDTSQSSQPLERDMNDRIKSRNYINNMFNH
jgi:hypothetical protein